MTAASWHAIFIDGRCDLILYMLEVERYIRLVCKSLERTGGKWMSGTAAGVLQHCPEPSISLLFQVLLSVPQCLIVRAIGVLVSAVYHKETPPGLSALEVLHLVKTSTPGAFIFILPRYKYVNSCDELLLEGSS